MTASSPVGRGAGVGKPGGAGVATEGPGRGEVELDESRRARRGPRRSGRRRPRRAVTIDGSTPSVFGIGSTGSGAVDAGEQRTRATRTISSIGPSCVYALVADRRVQGVADDEASR